MERQKHGEAKEGGSKQRGGTWACKMRQGENVKVWPFHQVLGWVRVWEGRGEQGHEHLCTQPGLQQGSRAAQHGQLILPLTQTSAGVSGITPGWEGMAKCGASHCSLNQAHAPGQWQQNWNSFLHKTQAQVCKYAHISAVCFPSPNLPFAKQGKHCERRARSGAQDFGFPEWQPQVWFSKSKSFLEILLNGDWVFLKKLAPNLRIEGVTLLEDLSKNNWADTQYYSRFLKPINSVSWGFLLSKASALSFSLLKQRTWAGLESPEQPWLEFCDIESLWNSLEAQQNWANPVDLEWDNWGYN